MTAKQKRLKATLTELSEALKKNERARTKLWKKFEAGVLSCKHPNLVSIDKESICEVCGTYFGTTCPRSKDGVCHRDNTIELKGKPAICLYCGGKIK